MPATLPRFAKELLRPGIYFKNGRRIVISADDVARRRESIRKLHANGLRVPLIYEHPEPAIDQVEGIPLPAEELEQLDEAEVLRRTVGKSVADDPRTLQLNEEGGLMVVFEVGDPNAATQLASKSIEFVSPEWRRHWQDGFGNEYADVVTHAALTHKPIQADQQRGFEQLSHSPFGRLADVEQLSIANLIKAPKKMAKTNAVRKPGKLKPADLQALTNFVLQLSSDDDDDGDGFRGQGAADDAGGNRAGGPGSAPENDNPDMPKTSGNGDAEAKQLEALLAHLAQRGFALPSDTTRENLIERLLTASMTLNAADAMNQADDHADDDDDSSDGGNNSAQEFAPMNASQMSAGGKPTKPGKPGDDPAARTALVGRIRACKNLPAGIREQLLVQAGATQFSAGAEYSVPGSVSITSLLEMYEEQATQFSAGSPQATLVERIKAIKGKSMPDGLADQLLARVGTVQFSNGAEVVGAGGVSVTSLVETYERLGGAVNGGLFTDKTANYQQLSGIVQPDHPGGKQYVFGQQQVKAGSKEAKEIATNLLQETGYGEKKGGVAINAVEMGRA